MQALSQTEEFSLDHLLGGRISIYQPLKGYRVAIDPIFLAAAVQAQEGEHILDVGAGVGAASLCLAYRVKNVLIKGIECQKNYVRFAAENVKQNDMRDRVEILHGDFSKPPPRLAAGTFDHVMANPPYIEMNAGRPSPHVGKATANLEGDALLEDWARFALLMVKPKGSITFIYRADLLDKILSYFYGRLGEITVYPLWAKKNQPAKRVIIQGRKNISGPSVLSSGMILHQDNGRYAVEADNILRSAAALPL